MKTLRATKGPFTERPYYEIEEIERICIDELRTVGLYPMEPMPIRIERFIEKRFSIHTIYEELQEGILGFSEFGEKGLRGITIAKSLVEEATKASERRINTTLAHEAGHGLLHAHLFAFGPPTQHLFDDVPNSPKILCRSESVPGVGQGTPRSYDGRWWEFQANRAMGALLLPRPLVEKALHKLLSPQGFFEVRTLDESRREEAVQLLAEVFEVNPVVARIRLVDVCPAGEKSQLTL